MVSICLVWAKGGAGKERGGELDSLHLLLLLGRFSRSQTSCLSLTHLRLVIDLSSSYHRTQTTFPLLSLAPALHHLSTSSSSPSNPLFPSQTPTPFALPPTSQPAALLERTAKALGLEVFRETTLDNTSNTFSSLPDSSSVPLPTITKEVVVLGGKALGIELELLESSEDQGTWTLAKFRCSLTLEGGPSDHHLAGVDELLGSSLRRLLELMKPAKVGEQTGEGETRELQAARELKEFERRLRQVVRMEGEGTQGDLFSRAEEIKSQVDGWLQSNGCGHSNW